jgi:hypothetical protein
VGLTRASEPIITADRPGVHGRARACSVSTRGIVAGTSFLRAVGFCPARTDITGGPLTLLTRTNAGLLGKGFLPTCEKGGIQRLSKGMTGKWPGERPGESQQKRYDQEGLIS